MTQEMIRTLLLLCILKGRPMKGRSLESGILAIRLLSLCRWLVLEENTLVTVGTPTVPTNPPPAVTIQHSSCKTNARLRVVVPGPA